MERPSPRRRSGGHVTRIAALVARALVARVLVVALVPALGCAASFRLPAEAVDPARLPDEALLEGMNPFALTNRISDRIEVEVDWVAGARPRDEALEGLRATLADILPAGKTVTILLDDEISVEQWTEAAGEPTTRPESLGRWLDADPGGWEDVERVWLLSVPDDGEILGYTREVTVDGSDGPRTVMSVMLFQGAIARAAELWITPRKVEQAILVHEFGHVLGLVANPEHVERGNPRHCTEPGCVMAYQRGRAQLYNAPKALFAGQVPDEYGARCRDDIRHVVQLWDAAVALDPDLVDSWRRQRQARELRAAACWYARRRDFGSAAARWREALILEGGEQATGEPSAISLERVCPQAL